MISTNTIEEIETLYNACLEISEVNVTKEDINRVIEFLKKIRLKTASFM